MENNYENNKDIDIRNQQGANEDMQPDTEITGQPEPKPVEEDKEDEEEDDEEEA